MNTILLIMAAGIGSRFGKGIKQLELVDASEHWVPDPRKDYNKTIKKYKIIHRDLTDKKVSQL